MSKEEQEKYKNKAKDPDCVAQSKAQASRKIKNSHGQVIEEVEAERKNQSDKFEAMKKEIQDMVQDASDKGGKIPFKPKNI